MDLIDRQAMLKYIEKIRQGALAMDDIRRASIVMNGMYLCEETVKNQPSAQTQRIRGKWKQIIPAGVYECSLCGTHLMTSDIDVYKFCHGCGAEMEGTE